MESSLPDPDIYTDVVLELLTAYMIDKSHDSNLSSDLMEIIRKDPVLSGKGLMQGLLFSSIIHMALMITLMALSTGKSREEVLSFYADTYRMTRHDVMKMPQVHPDFVNRLVEELDGLI